MYNADKSNLPGRQVQWNEDISVARYFFPKQYHMGQSDLKEHH